MDINRTIIAHDSTQQYTAEDFVNLCLAKETKACWDTTIEDPIDFYSYVYNHLLPGNRSDKALRSKRRATIHSFLALAKEHNYPISPSLFTKYDDLVAKVSALQSSIFPSYFSLISFLEENEVDYTIIFRTFGSDLHAVLEELALKDIPQFKSRSGAFYFDGEQVEHEELLQKALQEKFIAVQDDFIFWNTHKESSAHAKIMPVSDEHISLFFDDNVIENEQINIVTPVKSKTKKQLSIKQLINSGNIVSVNTLEALSDDMYFIKKLQVVININ